MKKIQIQNPKRSNSKRYLLFTVIFTVLSIIMICNAVSNNKKLTEDNFDKVEGVVTNIVIMMILIKIIRFENSKRTPQYENQIEN